MGEETVLEADVRDWQLGTDGEPPRIRLTVVSRRGNRTVVGETEAVAGQYRLIRNSEFEE